MSSLSKLRSTILQELTDLGEKLSFLHGLLPTVVSRTDK